MKNIRRAANTILAGLLLVFCFPLPGGAETISVQNGNSHTITGYATEIDQKFDFSIYWKDMTFVFDRGKYDVTTGNLVRASDIQGAQKGRNDGEINCWYGFYDDINSVLVLNRSNIDIYVKYTSEIDTNVCGENVKSELYDCPEFKVELDSNGDPKIVDDGTNGSRFGTGETPLEPDTEKTITASPADGTMYVSKVFLNITGAPKDDFTTSITDKAEMGTITINLSQNSASGDSTV